MVAVSEAQSSADLRDRIEELETRVQELERLLETPQPEETTSGTIGDVEFMDSTVFELDEETTTITSEAMDVMRDHERAYGEPMAIEHVVQALVEEGRAEDDARDAIAKLRREGSIYEPESGRVKVV